MTHAIRCACGALRGSLSGSGTYSRLSCYCTDCRAFSSLLARDDTLDDLGGTEIVQVAQSRLTISQGMEHLSAVRLSEKGMIRWYASCCNTPIGNTMIDPKVSFIGLIHTCLDKSKMDQDFGRSVAALNVQTALGDPKPKQRGLLGVTARLLWIVAVERLSGTYQQSVFFSRTGSPRVEPRILQPAELARLKSVAQPRL